MSNRASKSLTNINKSLCLLRFVHPKYIEFILEDSHNPKILSKILGKNTNKSIQNINLKFKVHEYTVTKKLDKYLNQVITNNSGLQSIYISSTCIMRMSIKLLSQIIQLRCLKALSLKNIFIKGDIQILIEGIGCLKGENSRIEELILKDREGKISLLDINLCNICELTELILDTLTKIRELDIGYIYTEDKTLQDQLFCINNLKILLRARRLGFIYIDFSNFKGYEDLFSDIIELILLARDSIVRIKINNFGYQNISEEQKIIFVRTLFELPNLVSVFENTDCTGSQFLNILEGLLQSNENFNLNFWTQWKMGTNYCQSTYNLHGGVRKAIIQHSECSSEIISFISHSDLQILDIKYHKGCGEPLSKGLFQAIIKSNSIRLIKICSYDAYIRETSSFMENLLQYINGKTYVSQDIVALPEPNTKDIFYKFWISIIPNTKQFTIQLLETNIKFNFQLISSIIDIENLCILYPMEIDQIKSLLSPLIPTLRTTKELRIAIFPGWHNLKRILMLIRETNWCSRFIFKIDCRYVKRSWPKQKVKNKERSKFFDWLREYKLGNIFSVVTVILHFQRLVAQEVYASPYVIFSSQPPKIKKLYI